MTRRYIRKVFGFAAPVTKKGLGLVIDPPTKNIAKGCELLKVVNIKTGGDIYV